MLKEIKTVAIERLMLDPNNPRFIKDIKERTHVPDDKLEEQQEATLRQFRNLSPRSDDDEEDVTNIRDLYDSLKKIGFVPIDRVVVRTIKGSSNYLVIEGNRRVAAAKMLLQEYESGDLKPQVKRQLKTHLPSFKTITCMLLDTKGLSKDEMDHHVSVILGLRHHGSLLPWEALPKAFNIYTEYMMDEPRTDKFELIGQKINELKERMSISVTTIKKALRTYIPYLQLRDSSSDVKDYHFSLIEYAVTNKNLAGGAYFHIDETTYRLTEASLAQIEKICQFSIRDNMPSDKKAIMPRPQSFGQLGHLVEKRQSADHEATKAYATDLIHQVEDEDNLEMTVEKADDALTDFINRKKWVDTVKGLLEKQEKDLRLEDYTGTGNARGYKDTLKETLAPLRKIAGV